MDEGKFGGKTDAYLLMTAEWVLPGRKAEEHDAARLQKILDVKKKLTFARWSNMLYYVVNKYEVVAVNFLYWLLCKKEIFADESSLLMTFCKERLSFVDTHLANVHPSYLTTLFCKRKQIAALATTYFQYASVC